MKITPVQETKYGIYLWQLPDGRVIADSDGNYLSIAAQEGDLRRIREIQQAAKDCGVEEGAPLFMPGNRKISDEEHERQKARLKLGLIPDEYDYAAYADEIRDMMARRNQ